MPEPLTVVIVLAAGTGNRLGASINKVFLPVGGKPMLAWSLELFESVGEIDEVVVVVAPHEVDPCRAILEPFAFRKVRSLVPGGASRHQSEFRGLMEIATRIESGAIGAVLVHDAARPFAAAALVRELITRGRKDAATPAVPAGPTLVTAGADRMVSSHQPSLWIAQTPQVFRARLLLHAHRRAEREGFEGSDTSSVLERAGLQVRLVEGSYDNIKITTPDDLLRAQQIARHRLANPDGEPPLLKTATLSA